MRQLFLLLAVLGGAIASAIFLLTLARPTSVAPNNQIAKGAAKGVGAPTIQTSIDDLNADATNALRRLPGVFEVQMAVSATHLNKRIIHLRDLHYITKDRYALALLLGRDGDVTAHDVESGFQKGLEQLELIQLEQIELLRCLIADHGLKKVFKEGLTQKNIELYRDMITALRAMEQEQIPQAKKQIVEIQASLQDAKGDQRIQLLKDGMKLGKVVGEHHHRLLVLGAAGRLLISNELEDVLPLEENDAFEATEPTPLGRRLVHDESKMEFRDEVIARMLATDDPVAVIILGGGHDLSFAINRFGYNWEYLRVTTKRYKMFSKKDAD